MGQDLADLRLPGHAIDRTHHAQQFAGLGQPRADLELAETAIEGELDLEPAEIRRFREHLGLDLGRPVPGRLAAGRRVEGKDQPSALAGRPGGRSRRHLLEEGVDICGRGFFCRKLVVARHVVRVPGGGACESVSCCTCS